MTVTLDSSNNITITDPGTGNYGTQQFKMRAHVVSGAAGGSWAARIADAGVVWYHNFDTAAEVNAFRWAQGYLGGNDPQSLSTLGPNVSWLANGGVADGPHMQIINNNTGDNCYWWRPFSPITGAGNGRGANDPGANGTLAPQSFAATNGGPQLLNWGQTAKPGWYGHADYQTSQYDGTDFYLQVRVKSDPRRTTMAAVNGVNGNGGKRVWITTTIDSYNAAEIVVASGFWNNGTSGLGLPNVHTMYQGYNYASIDSISVVPPATGTQVQLGSAISGVCDPYNQVNSGCWYYSGGWDTLLYHVTPGHNGVADTHLQVYAQHDPALFPAEAGVYTKITDVIYPAHFDTGTNSSGSPYRNGWNGLLLAIYQNGQTVTQYWHKFAQVIFSKATIAAPTV